MKKIFLFFVFLTFRVGCATNVSRARLNTLELGLSKDEIRSRIGSPTGVMIAQFESDGKKSKGEPLFEIWEYFVTNEHSSTLLYIYKDKLQQIEHLEGHSIEFDKDYNAFLQVPKIKFKIDKADLRYKIQPVSK